jgi:colanic acid/amylovoran biosynthesis protein
MIIGIMGAPLNNINLGCVAMCYSLITMFEAIRVKNNIDIQYIIFDYKYDAQKYDEMCDVLGVERSRVIFGGCGNISDPVRIIKHFPGLYRMFSNVRKCNFIVDMTEGDSFSDIYGDVIFLGRTNVKLLIERMGISLILGPQTYGPYLKPNNLKKALKAINNAHLVFSRDVLSSELVRKNGRKDIIQAIDMAFILPYKKAEETADGRRPVRIGINVSSMLYSDVNEMKVQRFQLRTDYKVCIEEIIKKYEYDNLFEIYLIPHVELDDKANRAIGKRHPNIKIISPCSNPVEVKSIISTMDLFIGARMHGTIAAFSSGVACIPMSYSRKFIGLYKSLGYDYVIDLEQLETKDAFERISKYVDEYQVLKKRVDDCKQICERMTNKIRAVFEKEVIWFSRFE